MAELLPGSFHGNETVADVEASPVWAEQEQDWVANSKVPYAAQCIACLLWGQACARACAMADASVLTMASLRRQCIGPNNIGAGSQSGMAVMRHMMPLEAG